MDSSDNHGMTEKDAKQLEVAMEVLRILLIGDDPFHKLINAHRSKDDAPADWTKGFSALFRGVRGGKQGEREDEEGESAKSSKSSAPPLRPIVPPKHDDEPIPLAPDSRPLSPPVAPKVSPPVTPAPQAAPSSKTPTTPSPVQPTTPAPTPTPPPTTYYGFKDDKDKLEAGPTFAMQPPEQRPNDPLPQSERQTSNVPAYDKPISVIIVGPMPVPVRLVNEAIVPGQPASNTPTGKALPGERKPKKDEGGVGQIAAALGKHFAIVFGPLMAFSTILSQANSGFSVFGKAVSLLGATLAPILLPFFVLLSVALIQVSQQIWTKLLPALEGFYKFLMEHGLAEVEKGVDVTGTLTDVATDPGKLKADAEAKPEEAKSKLSNLLDFAKKIAPGADMVSGGLSRFSGADAIGNAAGSPTTEKLTEKAGEGLSVSGPGVSEPKVEDGSPKPPDIKQTLGMVMKSLQMSIGPKAAYSGVSEAASSAQMAALNQDPIEAEMLKYQMQSFDMLGKIAANTGKEEAPPRTFDRSNEKPSSGITSWKWGMKI